jgi:DNA-dependent RNA polymerase auxiliary subunit epsilon
MDLLDGRILGGLQCKLYLNAEAKARVRRSKEINQFMIHFKSNCE